MKGNIEENILVVRSCVCFTPRKLLYIDITVIHDDYRDGRIKLFGAPGVEVLLQSPLRAPCKYLEVRTFSTAYCA